MTRHSGNSETARTAARAAILTPITVAAILWVGGKFSADSSAESHPRKSADEAVVCQAYGRQVVNLVDGQGKNDLIHAVKGTGAGEGSACWSEADELIRAEAGNVPQPGPHTIPEQMLEVRK